MRMRHVIVAILIIGGSAQGTRTRAQTPSAPGSSSSSSAEREWGGQNIRLGLSAGIQAGAPGFTQQSTLQIYAEDAPIAVDYGGKSALLVDGSVGFHVKGRFGVGVAVSYARSKVSGHITGEIPHPFHFDEPRAIDGTASGLPQVMVGTHVQFLYRLPVSPAFDVMFSAGPSLITVQQDLVNRVNFSETYPYDAATFESAGLVRVRKSAVGVNAGADATWHATPMIGVGILLRYTRGNVSLPIPDQSEVRARAGGVQAGVGVRLMF
jgi:hypothetical protein